MVEQDESAHGSPELIYKIIDADAWSKAEAAGVFHGASIDLTDGYIHFSTAAQVADTAQRHFANIGNLLLVSVDTKALGDKLVYEEARGGALFPHLYEPLKMSHVERVNPMPLGDDGMHKIPALDGSGPAGD
ncbi:MAG: DUF952 domain-containing protein [Pseudomonadota bacterium]